MHSLLLPSIVNRLWDRWANLHPFARFIIGASLIALILFAGVRPAYALFRSWQVGQNLKSSEVALAEGRMEEARDLSLTVLRTGNQGVAALRVLEAAMAKLRDPRHGEISHALLSHKAATRRDRLAGFRGLAPAVPMGVVSQAWNSLPETEQNDAEFLVIFADRMVQDDRLTDAATLLVSAKSAENHPLLRQRLIRTLIASGTPEAIQEAQNRLANEWPADGGNLSEWISLAEQIPVESLDATLLDPIRISLDRHASPDDADAGLMLARLNIAADFPRRAELIAETEAQWKSKDPVAYAKFLGSLGLPQMLVSSTTREDLEKHPALTAILARSYQTTENWTALTALIETFGHRMEPWEISARKALIFRATPAEGSFSDAWSAALEEAKSSLRPETTMLLYRFAKDAGLHAEAERAIVEAARLGRGPLPLYSDLKPVLESLASQGRESDLLQICGIYLAFEPTNPVLITQYAYLACLNDLVEPSKLLRMIEPMAAEFPDTLPIQSVLATLHLANGDAPAAAAVFDTLKLDPAAMAPPYRTAFETTQVLNGRLEREDPRIKALPWSELLPSEKRKFTSLLKLPELDPLTGG